MTNVLKEMDRYLLITSDSHAGPEHRTYGNYLEQKWRGDFNDWAKEVDEWIVQMRTVMGPRSIAVNGDPEVDGGRNGNLSSAIRLYVLGNASRSNL